MSNDTETTEAEIVNEERALVPAAPPAPSPALFGTTNPVEVLEQAKRLAAPLAELIEERHLYKMIRDRKHVLVEGWTLLGSMLGCTPRLVWTRHATDADGVWRPPTFRKEARTNREGETYEVRVVDVPGTGGWEARVELFRQGIEIGSAEMECRWNESGWEDSESYAVRSMAETRAISKAHRLGLSFVMELGGFATTPAEEMTGKYSDKPGTSSTDNRTTHECPHCGSPVIDKRDANEGSNRPVWVCSSSGCGGGSAKKRGDGNWPWGSYDSGFFVGEPNGTANGEDTRFGAGLADSVLRLAARHEGGDLDAAEAYLAELGIFVTGIKTPADANTALEALRSSWVDEPPASGGYE